jgi:hypothetical protein
VKNTPQDTYKHLFLLFDHFQDPIVDVYQSFCLLALPLGLFYLLWKNGIQGVYVGNVYELFIATSVTKFSLEILKVKMLPSVRLSRLEAA